MPVAPDDGSASAAERPPFDRPSERSLPVAVRALLVLWLVVAGLWAALQPALGDDTWWVLATGRQIVESGAIPHEEIFSFSAPGHPWYHQEWLTHSLFYVVYRWAGGDGLAWFKMAIAITTIVLLGVVAAKRCGSLFFGVLTAAFVAWACQDEFDIRAKIFTALNSVLMIWLLHAYRRGAGERILLFAPLLMLVWANLHYGFVYGLVILGFCCGTELVKSLTGLPDSPLSLRRSLLLAGAFVAATLACLVNPQPLGAFAIALEHMQPGNPWRAVIEWKPPPLVRHGSPTPMAFLLFFQLSAAAFALAVARRRFDITDLALTVATGMVALDSRRFVPLFAIVGAPLLARNLALSAEWFGSRLRSSWRTPLARSLAASSVAIVGTVGTILALVSQARAAYAPGLFPGMMVLSSFPSGAVEFLRANPLPGERLYNFYSWGGYLLYELPGVPIYVDGRAAVAYPRSISDEYRRIEKGGPDALAALERYDANVVLHHVGYDLPLRLRQQKDWLRVYDDGLAALFVRRTTSTAAWISRFERGELVYPDTPGAQLFAAEAAAARGDRAGAVEQIVDVIDRFPREGSEAASRRQKVELQASLTTDPKAFATVELYRRAFEQAERERRSRQKLARARASRLSRTGAAGASEKEPSSRGIDVRPSPQDRGS